MASRLRTTAVQADCQANSAHAARARCAHKLSRTSVYLTRWHASACALACNAVVAHGCAATRESRRSADKIPTGIGIPRAVPLPGWMRRIRRQDSDNVDAGCRAGRRRRAGTGASRNNAPGWPTDKRRRPATPTSPASGPDVAFAGRVVEGRRRGQAGRVDVLERAEDPQVAEIGDARRHVEAPRPVAARRAIATCSRRCRPGTAPPRCPATIRRVADADRQQVRLVQRQRVVGRGRVRRRPARGERRRGRSPGRRS